MAKYDGLIIPRSYSEYINKTDAATLSQALQNSGVMDNAPTENSVKPAKSGGIYDALSGKQPTLTFDTTPTEDSTNPVTSDGIYDALALKQDVLTFDNTPTENSDNPVKSGGLYTELAALRNRSHNTPRNEPKDITSYFTDGTIWKRLNGTDGYSLFEDIYVGDFWQMSRPISAPNQDSQYEETGTQWCTIAGFDTLMGNGDTYPEGDNDALNPASGKHHMVVIPGKGFTTEKNHFGKKRMNSSNTTSGGYAGSEMHTTTLGAVVSTGSTATGATINQQLYAEFGTHLKTTRELLSSAINSSGYNRLGSNSGCSSNWEWTNCQSVLMSEIEVYGSIVWSSSGSDTGNAKNQLPIFKDTRAINNKTSHYWLKDTASAAYFCRVHSDGLASYLNASLTNNAVRPRYVLGA